MIETFLCFWLKYSDKKNHAERTPIPVKKYYPSFLHGWGNT